VARIGSLEVSTSNERSATARRIRSAISKACSGGVSGSRIANSSPPKRAGRRSGAARPEDLGDALQHGVAGEVAVRVVDVAQRSRSAITRESGRSKRAARVNSSFRAAQSGAR
jgi:hypothetical protein